ncbi:hypothetical protein GCM10027277_32080 [Pseudoduganella ginsengisoli]
MRNKECIMTKVLFVTVVAFFLLINPRFAEALQALPDSNDDFGAV